MIIARRRLVLISAVIPWAVFTRYVLNSAASWPEPTAVLLTIVLTFFGAAACYRLGLHMNVGLAVNALPAPLRRASESAGRAPHGAHGRVHGGLGRRLCEATWGNTIADFPFLSTGVTYLPIPVGGAILLLFVIERMTLGRPTDTGGDAHATAAFDYAPERIAMDIAILLGTLFVLFALGVPIAYSLGARGDCRRLVDRRAARSGDAQDLRRRQQGGDADDPVFRARGRHHVRRRHGAGGSSRSPT